jgi:hypothetical protein
MFIASYFSLAYSAIYKASFSAYESKLFDFRIRSLIIFSISSSFVVFLNEIAAVALPNSPILILYFKSAKYLSNRSYI